MKGGDEMSMGKRFRDIKVRKTWGISPVERVHDNRRGKNDYSRSEGKDVERNWEDYIDEDEDMED